MDKNELYQMVKTLHEARQKLVELKEEEEIGKATLESKPYYQEYQKHVMWRKEQANMVKAMEADVRQAAIKLYGIDGENKVHGVTVSRKDETTVTFNNDDAVKYLVENKWTTMLRPTPDIESWLLSNQPMAANMGIDWASYDIRDKYTVRIQSNLSDVIVPEPEEDNDEQP